MRAQAQESNGNISFQPNVIPELNITFVEEFFRFQWRQNRFDLKLLIHCDGENHSLRNFWEATDRLVKWEMLKDKATESMYEFGYMISDIPEEIVKDVEFLVWKIEGASFELEEIELEEIELMVEPEPYNITRINLPGNLALSYEDLWLYDFTVSHPNEHETIVKGVKGKTAWNLDPITFSGGIITVIGGTEGSPYTFDDIWQADQSGGWGVVNKTVNQYAFDCRIKLGNTTVEGTTWLIDTNKQILIKSTAMSTGQYWMELTKYATLRLGVLVDATDKTTKDGCQIINMLGSDEIIIYSFNYFTEVSLYGCSVIDGGTGKSWIYARQTFNIYESELVTARCDTGLTVGDFFRVTFRDGVYGFYTPKGTMEEIYIHDTSSYAMRAIYEYAINIRDFTARDVTLLAQLYKITTDSYIINGDVDTWAFSFVATSTGEVYRQYTFDLTVTYPNGTTIQNANVTVKHYGQGETQDFTELTDSNGQITTKILSMGFYNQTGADTIYSYNPYHIEITNVTDYQDYSGNFTFEGKTEWEICLCPESYNWFGVTLIIGLLACFMFVIVLTTKK